MCIRCSCSFSRVWPRVQVHRFLCLYVAHDFFVSQSLPNNPSRLGFWCILGLDKNGRCLLGSTEEKRSLRRLCCRPAIGAGEQRRHSGIQRTSERIYRYLSSYQFSWAFLSINLCLEWFFAPLTKTMEIEVKYINRHKGRGVFAKRDFFEKEIVYLERPLSSHRNIDLSRVYRELRSALTILRTTSTAAITQWSRSFHTQSLSDRSIKWWMNSTRSKICRRNRGFTANIAKRILSVARSISESLPERRRGKRYWSLSTILIVI